MGDASRRSQRTPSNGYTSREDMDFVALTRFPDQKDRRWNTAWDAVHGLRDCCRARHWIRTATSSYVRAAVNKQMEYKLRGTHGVFPTRQTELDRTKNSSEMESPS